jgi:hypothetical protein
VRHGRSQPFYPRHKMLERRPCQSRPVRNIARAVSSSLIARRSAARAAALSPFAQAALNSFRYLPAASACTTSSAAPAKLDRRFLSTVKPFSGTCRLFQGRADCKTIRERRDISRLGLGAEPRPGRDGALCVNANISAREQRRSRPSSPLHLTRRRGGSEMRSRPVAYLPLIAMRFTFD